MKQLITGSMLIGGEMVGAVSGRTITSKAPATGDVIGEAPEAGASDVDRAVAAAAEAFPSWASLTPRMRAGYLVQFADAVAQRRDELARLDAVDSGNPLWAMGEDVDRTVGALRFYATTASSVMGSTIPATAQNLHFTQHEPFGIVGRIVPYNHPVLFAATRVAAPLLGGNAVIMKVAPQTPLSTLALGEIAREVFPPGVVNFLTGGSEAGEALATHPGVRRLAVIGSLRTGLAVQAAAAASGTLKDLTYELGGKNAMVLFDDVDPDVAARAVLAGMNLERCGGQSCGSTSRVLVHESIADGVIERVAAAFAALRIGDPVDESTELGPMITEEHLDRILRMVEEGRAQGGVVVTGGSRLDRPGYFMEPTVFSSVTPDSVIARDELFGPVVGFMPWSDPEEMFRIANSSSYGLTASVWTDDLSRAHLAANRLEAGYVWVNSVEHRWPGIPWGGVKDSGLGREYGVDEVLSYMQLKSVNVSLASRADGDAAPW